MMFWKRNRASITGNCSRLKPMPWPPPPSQSRVVTGMSIGKQLSDAGLLPHHCTHFEMILDPCDVVRFKIECHATEEQVNAIRAALLSNPEEARKVARHIIFRSQDDPEDTVAVDLPDGVQ